MRRLRDVFYINAGDEEGCYFYYGMEFREFIRFCPIPIDRILMLAPALYKNPVNDSMFMSTLDRRAISDLGERGAHNFGDFHWMDYRDEESLNRCSEQEKAEMLYLSHYCGPLHSPFFDSIGNHFVYLAHDDGWFCRLYCKDPNMMGDIIANKIIAFFSGNKRRKLYPIGDDIKARLLEMSKGGLLLDFENARISGRYWGLHLYSIGKFTDMDEMYHDLNRKRALAEECCWLEQKSKRWALQ